MTDTTIEALSASMRELTDKLNDAMKRIEALEPPNVFTIVRCDICNTSTAGHRRELAHAGWTFPPGSAICPNHEGEENARN